MLILKLLNKHVGRILKKRFDRSDLTIIICDIETLIVKAADGETVPEISEDIVKCFRGKINVSRLKVQLPMLPGAINTTFAGISVKKVTNVRPTYHC